MNSVEIHLTANFFTDFANIPTYFTNYVKINLLILICPQYHMFIPPSVCFLDKSVSPEYFARPFTPP